MLSLHPDLRMRSVKNGDGRTVRFLGREEKRDNRRILYLFMDRPIAADDTTRFEFVYEGEIARENVGLFYVTAGAEWYPTPVERKRSTFDLSFRTPRGYAFVATGDQVGEVPIGDTIMTRWTVTRPTRNVSFAIGPMERYEFGTDRKYPVEIYFSEQLHVNLGPALIANGLTVGRHMERQVGNDLVEALHMFDTEFGPYPYERLRAAEIIAFHGEAFPGFLHMGYPTWVQTDVSGTQKVFRAHEVAHQWWGVEVGYATYRDQWLSEAFAEYSALLYLQAADGTSSMLDLLREYRDDIFSVRKYLFGSGARSGAIALGYRAHSSETEGDYNLVVYKKGAFVLHMLRSMMIDLDTMEETRFFDMLREFYATYRGRDASTHDFQVLAERYLEEDLDWFFDQWVYGSQLPEYKLRSSIEQSENGDYVVRGRIEPRGVDSSFRMVVPLVVELETGARVYRRYLVTDQRYDFEIAGLAARPEKVRLNPFEAVLAKVDQ